MPGNDIGPHLGHLVGKPNTRDFAERVLRNIARSLHLNIGGPDHLAPLLSIVGDEFGEVGR